ncbi:MAG: tetratricopeptide repeat protein [Gemmatimonas sp.]
MLPVNDAIAARLRTAVQAHVAGRLAEAEALYREVLRDAPDQFDALHNLGVLKLEQRDHAAALDLLRRSLEVNPRAASAHLNIGSALRDLKRPAEAIASYDRALALRADYPQAHNNRGVALRDLGRLEDAVDSYTRAIAGNPRYVEALGNCATALLELRRHEDALACADRALAVRPDYLEAHLGRGHALYALKRYPEAIAAYREALRCGGNPAEIRYYLAAMGAEDAPTLSPTSYVEGLFDHYAPRFDQSLRSLKYRIPEMMFDMVAETWPGAEREIADLGCGTGLCGPLFRPMARTLVGVDLSANMLDQARARGVYDDLVKAEIGAFLAPRRSAFDLLIAADVLVYIGDLEALFGEAKRALREGGGFILSVESHDGEGFAIRPSRRYAHSLSYLRSVAERHGFVEQRVASVVVREEEGQDIPGFIVLLAAQPRDTASGKTNTR